MGPGPWTPAVRAIIIANAAVFLLTFVSPIAAPLLALDPSAVVRHGRVWQLVTHMFVHRDILPLVINMLMVWMFGVDLERRWGPIGFAKYYGIVGLGAAGAMVVLSFLPVGASPMYGASNAVYGLLLAWALVFPRRQLMIFMLFPVEARYAAMIYGAIAFVVGAQGGLAPLIAAIGGLLTGWIYLTGTRGVRDEIRYRLTKWRMTRLRRTFNLHHGGKTEPPERIH